MKLMFANCREYNKDACPRKKRCECYACVGGRIEEAFDKMWERLIAPPLREIVDTRNMFERDGFEVNMRVAALTSSGVVAYGYIKSFGHNGRDSAVILSTTRLLVLKTQGSVTALPPNESYADHTRFRHWTSTEESATPIASVLSVQQSEKYVEKLVSHLEIEFF